MVFTYFTFYRELILKNLLKEYKHIRWLSPGQSTENLEA